MAPRDARASQSPTLQDVPKQVALVNGSFEEPKVSSGIENRLPDASRPGDRSVPGWRTTASDHLIEIWHQRSGREAAHGEQYAELNANEASTLYQDLETTPGSTLYWSLRHRGRSGDDTMSVKIGPPDGQADKTWTFTDGVAAWGPHSGVYKVPSGQTVTRFAFEAGATGTGDPTVGNFLDDIVFGTEPCVVVTATAEPESDTAVGDTITCTVNLKNHGGVPAESLILRDAVPDGAGYVPGSLRIVDGPGDAADGRYDPQTRTLTLPLGQGATADRGGTLVSTADLPGGVTVEFQVRVERDGAGRTLANQATATYVNTRGEEEPLTSTSNTATAETAPDTSDGGSETPPVAACAHPAHVCVGDRPIPGGTVHVVYVPSGQEGTVQGTCATALTGSGACWPGCSRQHRWAHPGTGPAGGSLSLLWPGKKGKKRKHHKRLIRELAWQVSELNQQIAEMRRRP
ncbi:hypothetical protein GCM10010191_70500 [Actinomadura vinacea]|uniref:DUF11 domain-containing protein n=1 Tax=Actinomadura vinacea TaxID=115336 RepID=A0ABN3JY06_9ACTN